MFYVPLLLAIKINFYVIAVTLLLYPPGLTVYSRTVLPLNMAYMSCHTADCALVYHSEKSFFDCMFYVSYTFPLLNPSPLSPHTSSPTVPFNYHSYHINSPLPPDREITLLLYLHSDKFETSAQFPSVTPQHENRLPECKRP